METTTTTGGSDSSSSDDDTTVVSTEAGSRKRTLKEMKAEEDDEAEIVTTTTAPEPPKKRRKRNSDAGAPGSGTKRVKKKKKRKTPARKKEGLKLEDLQCMICRELPEGHIYQCSNGHFLCRPCHKRIRESKNLSCPICRVKLSRRNPPRNRLAEKYLESLEMECENDGCDQKIQFAYLKHHSEQECKFRTVQCKYEPLGCEWSGLAKHRKAHRKECTIPSHSAKQILKKVEARDEKREKKFKEDLDKSNKFADIAKFMGSRCRNIKVIDVCFEAGQEATKDKFIQSRAFVAFHSLWCLEIQADEVKSVTGSGEETKLKIRLVAERKIKHHFIIGLCILTGPDNPYKLEPLTFEAEISRSKDSSAWIDYPCDPKTANTLAVNQETLNLRVLMIDRRRGDVSREFRGDEELEGDYQDSLSSDMTSGSDYSHESEYSDDYDDEDDDDDYEYEY